MSLFIEELKTRAMKRQISNETYQPDMDDPFVKSVFMYLYDHIWILEGLFDDIEIEESLHSLQNKLFPPTKKVSISTQTDDMFDEYFDDSPTNCQPKYVNQQYSSPSSELSPVAASFMPLGSPTYFSYQTIIPIGPPQIVSYVPIVNISSPSYYRKSGGR